MADGTQSQVPDGSGAEGRQAMDARLLNADTGRVARIVAALRTAHAEQGATTAAVTETVPETVAESAVTSSTTTADVVSDSTPPSVPDPAAQTAELPDAPAPRRESSGVRSAAPAMPTLRWNPGARYRASRLADHPALSASAATVPGPPAAAPAGQLRVPPPPVPAPPVPAPPVPGPPPLAGRLYRGPARRTGVFEREIWYPAARSSRVPRDVSDALIRAVERYRTGSISTSGLVRAIAQVHAA